MSDSDWPQSMRQYLVSVVDHTVDNLIADGAIDPASREQVRADVLEYAGNSAPKTDDGLNELISRLGLSRKAFFKASKRATDWTSSQARGRR